MAKSLKIEPRTDRFIEEYARLEKESKMPAHADLAKIMGVNTVRTISEILGRRQNIQPDSWTKFKQYFGVTEIQNNPEQQKVSGIDLPGFMALLEEKEARRKDAENHLAEIKAEKEARIRALEKEKDNYLRLLESNLNVISDRQLTIQAQVQAVQQWDAQVAAAGDKEKEAGLLEHIQKLTAGNRERLGKKNKKPVGGS